MLECDGCEETRCGVCLERDQMIHCDGCDRTFCGGRNRYDDDEDKEECRLEECCAVLRGRGAGVEWCFREDPV